MLVTPATTTRTPDEAGTDGDEHGDLQIEEFREARRRAIATVLRPEECIDFRLIRHPTEKTEAFRAARGFGQARLLE